MRVVGVIPARWAALRLPGKSLVEICGKPLIHWVVERVQQAKRLDDVLVATDDSRILESVTSLGCKAVMTSVDHMSGTDRIAEAVSDIDCSVVVNIQGDEPLIDPDLIDDLVELMLGRDDWDMATAATPITGEDELGNPSVVKVVCNERGGAMYFSRSMIPSVRDSHCEVEDLHLRHLGIYAYKAEFLARFVAAQASPAEIAEKLEQLRALHIGGRIRVLKVAAGGIGVDTPEDVKYAEEALRKAGLAG